MIPLQLQNNNFRFIKLGTGDWCKRPTEKGWSVEKNYKWDSKDIQDHIAEGKNYGVVGGYGNLLIIDFDSSLFQEKLRGLLPPTFSVKTGGKGLTHLYYIIDEPFCKFGIRDTEENVVIDFQCKGSYVVGSGSIHDSGKSYEVLDDLPINNIKKADLQKLFTAWQEREIKIHEKPMVIDQSTNAGRIKSRVRISNVLQEMGVKAFYGNKFACPFHAISKGNKYNAQFDDTKGVYFCHHEQIGGDAIDLWQRYKGCDFKEAIKDLARLM